MQKGDTNEKSSRPIQNSIRSDLLETMMGTGVLLAMKKHQKKLHFRLV